VDVLVSATRFDPAAAERFALPRVAPGRYVVAAEAPGFVPAERVPVRVEAGVASADVRLRLVRR
jgi:hypothetical protein